MVATSIKIQRLSESLRRGWYLRSGVSKCPYGYIALEYGMDTTTAARTVVACIHPRDLNKVRDLYPEAFATHAEWVEREEQHGFGDLYTLGGRAITCGLTYERAVELHPEWTIARVGVLLDRCPTCGGLNPGDITHTRC